MDSGFYAACAGLRAQSQALELAANNLANLNTPGFRGQSTSFQSLLAQHPGLFLSSGSAELNNAINRFGVIGSAVSDLAPGSFERTDSPLNLALDGPGFFVVQTPAGLMYTRNGSFQLSAKGQLITAQGDSVLGEQGPVILPAGSIGFGPDGSITINGLLAGKLRLVEFPPGTGLEAQGTSYYAAPAPSARPTARTTVRQGMLEASNVNAVTAAVGLISLQRQAEMLQRTLSAFYSEFNRIAANDLPRV